ncbi:TPA: hypothetical protein PPN70_003998 [Serratia rubidaea]|nr:hypothetical protein [Serratia rubidaea]HDJ1461517.1 hypothetical protein [Serratia rubidaea]HDJ2773720.1 hypothetical protein [Serratia rubidaea]
MIKTFSGVEAKNGVPEAIRRNHVTSYDSSNIYTFFLDKPAITPFYRLKKSRLKPPR